MKQRGFTLIELLGVIVILSLLVLIITPVVTNVMKDSKEELYEKTIDNIKLAAKNWINEKENKELLPSIEGNCLILSLTDLKASGYIDLDIKDPRTGKKLDDEDTMVLVTRNGKNYDLETITDGNLNGKVCYTEVADPTAPVISTNIFSGYQKNFGLKISYASDYGLSANNKYQYYLSTEIDSLKGGTWTNYTNGGTTTIGTNLNGTYYLFVRRIQNTEGINSMLGGVLVNVGSDSYQRFGPYKFDNVKPTWKFSQRTNTNTTGKDQLESLVNAYKEDTVTITITGTDLNHKSSSLTKNNIKILIGGVDYTSQLTTTLSTAKNINNGVSYTLTIKNITQKGALSLVIDANTLTDEAGNTNAQTTINTGIITNTCTVADGTSWDYAYTGGPQNFKAPCAGTYKIELYGAQGGTSRGGKGAYTAGNLAMIRNQTLTVSVGGKGGDSGNGGYNGGGAGVGQGGGGGATDIRVGAGGYNNRIMVAAGGGGGSSSSAGGAGGAPTGGNGGAADLTYTCYTCTSVVEGSHKQVNGCSTANSTLGCVGRLAGGASQTAGGVGAIGWHVEPYMAYWAASSGKLGKGGAGYRAGAGGGGGLYGGGGSTAAPLVIMGAGGGSSCISGHSGCHNANYQFTNATWTAGNNSGHGKAKITLVKAD